MSHVPDLILAAGLLANILLYKRHHRKYGTYRSGCERRIPYRVARATLWFRYVKYLLYLAAFVYILFNPGVPRSLKAGPGVATIGVGTLLGASGIVLLYASLEALGDNYAPCDKGLLPYERVSSGPYKYLTHPMYLANILQLAGAAFLKFGPLIVAIAVVYASFIAFIAREERAALEKGIMSLRDESSPPR